MIPTTAILIRDTAFDTSSLLEYYLIPLEKLGIPRNTIIIKKLIYSTPSKVQAKTGKAWLDKLREDIPSTITRLIVADANYFKWLAKSNKITDKYGMVLQAQYKGYTDLSIVYVPNYKSLFKQPENNGIITAGLNAMFQEDREAVIHTATYAFAWGEDISLLDQLHQYPALTIDIESAGLEYDSHPSTISFAWDKHNGIAIDLDQCGYVHTRRFLQEYTGTMIFHNALFDCKLLIRNWWMEDATDYSGMQKGLDVFTNAQDTMLLAYLAKNATTPVSLKLKDIALDYVGNYAIEVTDIYKHTRPALLKYNLMDTLATWYVHELYSSQLTSEMYTVIMQPSIKPLLKMMLVGLPMDAQRVNNADDKLQAREKILQQQLLDNPIIEHFNLFLRQAAMEAANNKLKVKVRPLSDFDDVVFNPNSGKQIAQLLYGELKLPVLDTTKNGNPATDNKVLKNLKNHTTNIGIIEIIDCILGIAETSKISGTFLKAFKKGGEWLHGNLKLGGTQSCRLSSNSPNLQNLPAQGIMGKLIKTCFVPPKGFLWAGADFSSLEDRIGAILSKDPNKIKIYTDGFDAHCVNAHAYYQDQMPDINPESVISINSIEEKYPVLRQASKQITFASQYGGTAYTHHKNAGIPLEDAERIEKAFKELYKVSEEFMATNQTHMENTGYVECAFGMRLHTPIVSKCILGNTKTPYEATAEVRSANNAVTQSWGTLMNRAIIATNQRVEQLGKHLDILPVCTIHDSVYFMVRDDPTIIKILNDILIEEMQWQEHPTIASVDVPMKANMEIGPDWATQVKLPNQATETEIQNILIGL
jgi:DNA polymerase-1